MKKKTGYKRGWSHTKKRGKEHSISCSFCGKSLPKYKTFPVTRGFRISDPVLRKEIGARNVFSLSFSRMHACPACARHRGIVRGK